MTRVVFVCCFCTQECPGDVQVALVSSPGEDDETQQMWFCHHGCFVKALHDKIKATVGVNLE